MWPNGAYTYLKTDNSYINDLSVDICEQTYFLSLQM